jgi:hypothetical protein
VLNSQKIEIQTGDEKLMLPVRSPKTRIKQGSMLFQAYICEKQENGDVEEEKTITLKDLERKGQWISLILT